jgi:predicted nucleic acid-binding protein
VRLFFDLNVILDVLARREPWLQDSAAALSFVAEGKAEGLIAAHTVTTLDYLLRKHVGAERAAGALVDLLGLVRAVGVDHELLHKALALGWTDFEDAVQAVCALDARADYLITRDRRPFAALTIPVVSPSELLGILAGEQD